MRRLSKLTLPIGIYTIISEAVNEYTTLLGWSHGFYENDPTARFLLSISPVVEGVAVFAIPVTVLLVVYLIGYKWVPSTRTKKRVRKIVLAVCLLLLVLLAINTTDAAISDFNTLHAYHIV